MIEQFEALRRMPWRRTDQTMFQLFLRARVHKYFGGRATERDFKARSAERDVETDRLRVGSILLAIDTALTAAEAEQSGLAGRVDDFLARATVTFGNGTDEYLTRETIDTLHQDLFDNEISNGQRRLQELAVTISHFKFLRAAMLSRFPDFRPPANNQPAIPRQS
jgi:hypothetical protein